MRQKFKVATFAQYYSFTVYISFSAVGDLETAYTIIRNACSWLIIANAVIIQLTYKYEIASIRIITIVSKFVASSLVTSIYFYAAIVTGRNVSVQM